MDTKEITKAEYWSIVGLLALARTLTRQVQGIEEALREITGEDDNLGHCGDAAWGFDDAEPEKAAKVLLKKIGVAVKKQPPTNA